MTDAQMETCKFEHLLSSINQETDLSEKKLQILYESKGLFSGYQVAKILYAFGLTCDRLKALEIIENRLVCMTCCEAKDILGTFSIMDDKLRALLMIKRYICDLSKLCSQETILSCFIFPEYRKRACEIMHIIKVSSKDMLAAGGHVIHSPCGSILTQAPPLDPSLYSTIYMECYNKQPAMKFRVPHLGIETSCQPPTYSEPCKNNFLADESHGCPASECPAKKPLYNHYPSGAAPLGLHNPTARTGFSYQETIDRCKY